MGQTRTKHPHGSSSLAIEGQRFIAAQILLWQGAVSRRAGPRTDPEVTIEQVEGHGPVGQVRQVGRVRLVWGMPAGVTSSHEHSRKARRVAAAWKLREFPDAERAAGVAQGFAGGAGHAGAAGAGSRAEPATHTTGRGTVERAGRPNQLGMRRGRPEVTFVVFGKPIHRAPRQTSQGFSDC